MHYQVAERSLLLLSSDAIQKQVEKNKVVLYPVVIRYLVKSSKKHWNQQVLSTTLNVMRNYMELDQALFEQ